MPFRFELLQTDGQARLGRISTPHGLIDTPVFMAVGTQASVKGLTPAQARLRPDQSFFAVWILVENRSQQTQTPTSDFRIIDTQHNTYRPIVPTASNEFAYRSYALPGKGQIPDPEGPAYNSPTEGAMVLFKVSQASYDNRPLTFAITDHATGQTATTDLDV